MVTTQEKLGRRIKARRALFGWDQQQLAHKTGISQKHISRYERGDFRQINVDRLLHLANALQTTTDYLLGRGDPEDFDSETFPAEPALAH